MGRYQHYQRKSVAKPGVHPIWRGIGCILIVVAPLISYALTAILIPILEKTGLVPGEIMGQIKFPDWVYRSPILNSFGSLISSIKHPWFDLTVFFVILILLVGIVSLIFVVVLQMTGLPRYGKMDAPPSRQKAKPYKR
jgi:hypothetical protein